MGNLTLKDFQDHTEELLEQTKPVAHRIVLTELQNKAVPIDFYERVGKDPEGKERVSRAEYHIIVVEEALKLARQNCWGLCRHLDFTYLYNGAYWKVLDDEELKGFLGEVAERIGVPEYRARHYTFRDALHKQFITTANLPAPEPLTDTVRINLQNGTFWIAPEGTELVDFDRKDFLTYQLPFTYDSLATAPRFEAYLNQVLPDPERQQVLAEFIGYVFVHSGVLKLEKALILYGSGANGKSVFFEIVNALIGKENFASHSLQNLTNENGYYRAMIANKLVNYASEINGKLEAATFKQLVSGEPVGARLPYGKPIIVEDYAKLIFNCNELPRDVEFTNAFFRRFLIIPFDETIPEEKQDKELATKIINNELAGVFNWVLGGLERILAQKKFSQCNAADNVLQQYRKEADSVAMFLEDEGYQPDIEKYIATKELYSQYKQYCVADGFKCASHKTFNNRIRAAGITVERKAVGNVAYLIRHQKAVPY